MLKLCLLKFPGFYTLLVSSLYNMHNIVLYCKTLHFYKKNDWSPLNLLKINNIFCEYLTTRYVICGFALF